MRLVPKYNSSEAQSNTYAMTTDLLAYMYTLGGRVDAGCTAQSWCLLPENVMKSVG